MHGQKETKLPRKSNRCETFEGLSGLEKVNSDWNGVALLNQEINIVTIIFKSEL